MTPFYFHIRSWEDLFPDTFGLDLADLSEVSWAAGELVRGLLDGGSVDKIVVENHSFEVANSVGDTVLLFPFASAFKTSDLSLNLMMN